MVARKYYLLPQAMQANDSQAHSSPSKSMLEAKEREYQPQIPLTVEKEVKQPMDIGHMGDLIRKRRERDAARNAALETANP